MSAAAEWLDRVDALARKHGPAYEALSREYHPRAVAALRAVLDLHRTTTEGTCQVCWTTEWAEQGLTIYSRPTPILAPCPTVRAITEALT